MKNAFIISDIDECLTRTLDALQDYVFNKWRLWFERELIKEYEVEKSLFPWLMDRIQEGDPLRPVSELQLAREFDMAVWKNPQTYINLRPHVYFWQKLFNHRINYNENLVFLTSREPWLNNITQSWLVRWGFDEIPISNTKEKVEFIKRYLRLLGEKQIIFVEDKLQTAIDVSLALDAVEVIILARPWNDREDLIEDTQDKGADICRMTDKDFLYYRTCNGDI